MSDRLVQIVAIAAMLLLVIRGLSSRGLGFGRVVGLALTWTIIFFAGFLIFAVRDEAGQKDPLLPRADGRKTVVTGGVVRIPISSDGHFWVRGRVNGVETRFMIDSGATTTALSSAAVRDAAIVVDQQRMPVLIGTANGSIEAKRLTIDRLEIGPITVRNVPAITADGFGTTNVIGMNILSRLHRWGVENGTMVLQP